MFSKQMASLLDEKLQEKSESANVPGMALTIAQNGETIYENYYGYRNVKEQLPVTPGTIFGVASITKSLTALAIMQLEDLGKLSVDDFIMEWLPELQMPNQAYLEKMKIHHLMTHTSGLPGMNLINSARSQSIRNDPDGSYLFGDIPVLPNNARVGTVMDLIRMIGETEFSLLGPPGAVFNYSNEGYALLQEIMERASGQAYIKYMKENLLHPLGMNQSYFLTSDLANKSDVTELYAYKKDAAPSFFHSPVWWDVGEIYSNGSLKSSSKDLMKYLEVYRLDGLVGGKRIVSKESIRKMTSSQVSMPTGERYGYGLQVDDHHGINLFGHGGSIKGVSSHFKVVKASGVTVSVLINLADVAAEDMAITSINHLLELPDLKEFKYKAYKHTPNQLGKITGLYQSVEGKKVRVSLYEDKLQFQINENEHQFIGDAYALNGFISPDGEALQFLEDHFGKITGVFMGKRVIPKIS